LDFAFYIINSQAKLVGVMAIERFLGQWGGCSGVSQLPHQEKPQMLGAAWGSLRFFLMRQLADT